MHVIRPFFFTLILISSFSVNAAVTKAELDRLAAQFYLPSAKVRPFSAMDAQAQIPPAVNCVPRGPSCVEEACKALGSYNCDDMSEIERVASMCRGNLDGACVKAACQKLGSYNCDDMSEMERVTALCRTNLNGDCISTACKFLGSYNCDDLSEMERVGRACQGVDGQCVESVCSRVGTYNCDDLSEMERVAKACRGN